MVMGKPFPEGPATSSRPLSGPTTRQNTGLVHAIRVRVNASRNVEPINIQNKNINLWCSKQQ